MIFRNKYGRAVMVGMYAVPRGGGLVPLAGCCKAAWGTDRVATDYKLAVGSVSVYAGIIIYRECVLYQLFETSKHCMLITIFVKYTCVPVDSRIRVSVFFSYNRKCLQA